MSQNDYVVSGLTDEGAYADQSLRIENTEQEWTELVPVTGVETDQYIVYDEHDLPDTLDFDYVWVTPRGDFGAETYHENGSILVLQRNVRSGEYEVYNYASHTADKKYLWERPFTSQRVFEMLISNGVTGTAALDWYMCKGGRVTHRRAEWAEQRGVSEQAITDNILRAEKKLGPDW